MDYAAQIQPVLQRIDARITERLTVAELAAAANFSPYHFSRVFQGVTGMPVMLYVTRRKLQFALDDLSRGKKVVDVAMEYGFETHAGFTKAFRRCFGYPPSLYRVHGGLHAVGAPAINQNKTGGILMNYVIKEMGPITIAGYASRHTLPDVKHTRDVPAWWDSVNMEFSEPLTRLHRTFSQSKHCEYGICFDVDLETGGFTYLLGVGVDNAGDLNKIEPDMRRIDLPGGEYAVFTTPMVPSEQYADSIRETWKEILLRWLPDCGYEFDDARMDFEYYDQRDHAWEHDNMVQMDICIPVKKKS